MLIRYIWVPAGCWQPVPELVLQELPRKSKFLGRAVLCLLENAVGVTAGGEHWHRGLGFEIGHTALKSPVAKIGGASTEHGTGARQEAYARGQELSNNLEEHKPKCGRGGRALWVPAGRSSHS